MPRKRKGPSKSIQNDPYKIECQICGKLFESLVSHISRKHNISIEEYKQTYGTDYVMADVMRHKLSTKKRNKRKMPAFVARDRIEVVDSLAVLYRGRKSLSSVDLQREDPTLYNQVIHIFGSWTSGVKAAEIISRPNNRWSKDKIFSEIHRRIKQDKSLRDHHVRQDDPNLRQMAKAYFGSWYDAVRAAGLAPSDYRGRVERSKKGLIQDLNRFYLLNGTLTAKKIQEQDSALYAAVIRHFGGVEVAARACGVRYSRLQKKWTREDVIASLKARMKAGHDLASTQILRKDSRLHAAAQRYFGTWYQALEAAGIRSEQYRSLKDRSIQSVKESLIQLANGQDALTSNFVVQSDGSLYHSVRKRFGSVEAACRELKIPYKRMKQSWDKQSILQEIRRLKKKGENYSAHHLRKSCNGMVKAAYRIFGSWPATLSAAGIES